MSHPKTTLSPALSLCGRCARAAVSGALGLGLCAAVHREQSRDVVHVLTRDISVSLLASGGFRCASESISP